MRVVPDEERLVPPFICFLCETSPQREAGVHVVDTQRNFDPPAPSPLKGRKLVCERCVEEMANLLGFRNGEQVDDAKAKLDAARAALEPIQHVIQSLAADIRSRVTNLYDLPQIEQIETSPVIVEARKKDKEEASEPAA